MSSPAHAILEELLAALNGKADLYLQTFSAYLGGRIPREEFDELVRQALTTSHLIQLHNSVIISVLGSSLDIETEPRVGGSDT